MTNMQVMLNSDSMAKHSSRSLYLDSEPPASDQMDNSYLLRWQSRWLRKLQNPCIHSVSGDNWMASGFQSRVDKKHLENWYWSTTLTSPETQHSPAIGWQTASFSFPFFSFFFFLILSKKIELVTHGLCILQILPPARNFNHSQPLLSHLSQLRRLQLLKGTCDFHNIFLSYWSKPFKPLYFITCYSTPNGLWTRGNGLDK